jgi:MFS family permease
MPRFSADQEITLRILPAVAFTFVAYFCIGAPLAILPAYLHLQLGISTVLAGFLVSLQYIATFASRPRAGHLSDTIGPRRTVRYGLLACTASGALMVLAGWLRHSLWLSLGTLALSRLALGTGESLSSTGSTMWGIGRVGGEHTARVISWNGVATYTAIAVGAPLGVLAASAWGFAAVGAIIFCLCSVSYLAATRMAPTAPFKGQRVPIGHILLGVTPYGMALALGGTGFGVIATFVTLYFAHRNWQGAALSLTVFGLCFVGVRLLFARTINRYGGFAVAIISFCVEVAGLALLGLGRSHALAYMGCGLAGMGFSLIFPALGVEAANAFPASVRGSVIGVYSAFADLSLFLAGPLAGAVIHGFGYSAVFLATAGAVLVALAGTIWLSSSSG